MAKRKKKEQEPFQLPPELQALRRPVLYGVVLVALVGGLFIIWQGLEAWQTGRSAPRLEALREQLSTAIQEDLDARTRRIDAAVADPYLRADLAAGALESAAGRAAKVWNDAPRLSAFSAQLQEVFGPDLGTFGYTRLQLINRARIADGPVVGTIGKGTQVGMGIAAPAREESRTLGVILAEFPVEPYIEQVRAANLPGGYLDLRTETTVLVASGVNELAKDARTVQIAGSGLWLGIASPPMVTMIPYDPPVQMGLGLIALLLATLLLWQLRRAPEFGAAPVRADEPTFSQTLAHQQQPDPKDKAEPQPVAPALAKRAVSVDRSIFRAYDIRGVVGKSLDEGVARLIGQAVGSLMAETGLREIVVGRDGRLSGPALSEALIEGLRAAGRDVIDIGMAPTPVVYFGAFQLNTGCCIALTGSHNPPDYNGFKIVVGGETLHGGAIQNLYARIAEGRLTHGGGGGLQQFDILDDYVSRIGGDVQLERRLRVVVDCGNGVAGVIAPAVLEAIGCEVEPLYCDVDGNFPNHHPDPSEPENLRDLTMMVKRLGFDLGIAFDGDGDRLGVVSADGENIFPDRLLMLFAQDVLSRNPGAAIIYDVKCTGHLAGHILRNGGSPIMWKTGHSLIKAKMRETEAELAGEMSGHFFFRERWFGFDDGIYAAARLLEILAADGREPVEVFAELPKGVSTPELKVHMEEGAHYAFMERFAAQAKFEGAKIATIDGIRADWQDGWGLVRCSNTTPCLVLRFDADNDVALSRMQETFRAQLLAVDAGLKLPF
ncbi:phosphomannomutase/phosphoglucomutase [Aquimonas sp.]|jgi:phosphomannomutase/phosphoglucomutase|uniref:phosphomannomutase/phosphoglucomutase n=1 Tax=Aquimonas sp. TaxID=1872588 RepID=UPI0037C17216